MRYCINKFPLLLKEGKCISLNFIKLQYYHSFRGTATKRQDGLLYFSEIDIHPYKNPSSRRDEIIILRNYYSEYIVKTG